MSVTTLAQKVLQYPWNPVNAVLKKAWVDAITAAANAGTLTANALSADATGRAVMATGFFNEATATAKFAAAAITTALLKAGIISADATGRALFAAGVFDLATATSAFAANSIDESKLARRIAAQALSGAGAINKTTTTTLFTSTGASQALTLADGDFVAQRKRIIHIADGGSGVITQTTGAKLTASITTITFTNIWDWVELEWSGTLWNVVGYTGVAIA